MFTHLRLTCRGFVKHPGFAVVAIIILALGIGASTAVFSVVHALLLSPLRYGEAERLVQIRSVHPQQGFSMLAPATAIDIGTQARSFDDLASQTYYYVNLTGSGSPALVTGVQATANYFKVFGVAPLLGRTWNPDECRPGAAPVVVLGQQLWETQYGGRHDLIGDTILMDDTPTTVIGVMPKSFIDPWGNGALWMPMPLNSDTLKNRSQRYWSTFARFAPGSDSQQATAELATIARGLEQQFPDNYRAWSLQADDLHGLVVGDYRPALFIILGAVGCVMLITCANIAGLCLVRAAARRKELAIRIALGATRGQLTTQLLIESLLLAALGGIAGILLANWGLAALLASIDGWLPRSDEITLSTPVLLGALVLTLITGVAFGLAPALTSTRVDAQDALKDVHSATGAAAQRLRSGLVIAEIALALVLLVGAGLLGRNLYRILTRDTGIEASRVLSLTLTPSEKRYDTAEKRGEYYRRALAEVGSVPGVESAAFTQTSPFRWGIPISLSPVPRDGALPTEGNLPQVFYDSVSRDYFKTMGTALRAGRWFNDADVPTAKPVVVISESTARRFFGEENPVGRELTPNPSGPTRFEIVGVVADIARTGLAAETPLQVYRPMSQRPTAFATLMVRTSLPPASLAKAVQAALWRVDPDIPFSDVTPMDRVVSRTATQPRLYLTLFGVFAGLALTLAGVGLYGLIAYSVAQRTREFGIRTALGASASDVLRLVLREGGVLIGIGLALGLIGALGAARLIQQLLFAHSAYDPFVFAGVLALLGTVALAACLIPARRAARVDPLVALRTD